MEGSQRQVDQQGCPVKKYFNYVTGSSNFTTRQTQAEKTGNKLYAAEVPQSTNLNFEMLPGIL